MVLKGTINMQLVENAGKVTDAKTWFAVIGWEGSIFVLIA